MNRQFTKMKFIKLTNMVLEHMKKRSTSFIIGYMRIKSTSKYHFSPITLATNQNPDNMPWLRGLVRHPPERNLALPTPNSISVLDPAFPLPRIRPEDKSPLV